jgi:hypothetical protein
MVLLQVTDCNCHVENALRTWAELEAKPLVRNSRNLDKSGIHSNHSTHSGSGKLSPRGGFAQHPHRGQKMSGNWQSVWSTDLQLPHLET